MKSYKYILATSVFLGCYDYSFAAPLALPDFPLRTTAVVEPNVIFLMDTSGSMGWNIDVTKPFHADTNPTRMPIAKRVAKEIIEETEGVRFCLARFSSTNHGGQILNECKEMTAANKTAILNSIDGLPTSGGTPLGESYYEVTSYFQGKKSIYRGNSVSYVGKSPIQYRCQKNFAIVMTDGYPSVDSNFPGLNPNYDGIDPPTPYQNPSNPYDISKIPAFSDGIDGLHINNGGSTFYLDDIAKYAYDIDLRGADETDLAGKSFNDSLFSDQNLSTYTVGFTVDMPMLQEAADYGNGIYSNASNYNELKQFFSSAITDIASKTQSVTTATANSHQLSEGLRIYQTSFIGNDWTGKVSAYKINESTFEIEEDEDFKSHSPYIPTPWGQRPILTDFKGGRYFRYSIFNNDEKQAYFNGTNKILQFTRGNTEFSEFRERKDFLGDIVNSSPVYFAPPSPVVPEGLSDSVAAAYTTFATNNEDRGELIFAGANDGMLHAFSSTTGEEVFAFLPELMFPKLKLLTDKNYQHEFYVDGTPVIENVYATFPGSTNAKWQTMLVGGYGKGGQGIYAINVTDADELTRTDNSAKKLTEWSFTDKDLGFTYSQPQIMRLGDGKYYVVLSSGYNNTQDLGNGDTVSTSGDAVLYIIDIGTGALVHKLSTGVGKAEDPLSLNRPNGLAAPKGIDVDSDNTIDYIYAGDLFGNMWKFDVSSVNPSAWSGNPKELFIAKDSDGNRQPITVQPEVVQHSADLLMVYFGTGKLLEVADTDSSNIKAQSFYGIIDSGDGTTVSRSALLRQAITYQGVTQFESGESSREIRVSSNESIDVDEDKGWYIDLLLPAYSSSQGVVSDIDVADVSYSAEGDQVVTTPVFKDGKIRFITNEANYVDKCLPSSKNFFMELNAVSGSRLNYIAIDLNGDGVIDDKDGIEIDEDGNTISISGITVNSNSNPVIVKIDDVTDLAVFGNKDAIKVRKDNRRGERTSWREIRNN